MAMPKNSDGSHKVTLEFSINTEGRPINITVLDTTDEDYNEVSISSLTKFRFAPVVQDGEFIQIDNLQHTMSYYTYASMTPLNTNFNRYPYNYSPILSLPGANGQQ